MPCSVRTACAGHARPDSGTRRPDGGHLAELLVAKATARDAMPCNVKARPETPAPASPHPNRPAILPCAWPSAARPPPSRPGSRRSPPRARPSAPPALPPRSNPMQRDAVVPVTGREGRSPVWMLPSGGQLGSPARTTPHATWRGGPVAGRGGRSPVWMLPSGGQLGSPARTTPHATWSGRAGGGTRRGGRPAGRSPRRAAQINNSNKTPCNMARAPRRRGAEGWMSSQTLSPASSTDQQLEQNPMQRDTAPPDAAREAGTSARPTLAHAAPSAITPP